MRSDLTVTVLLNPSEPQGGAGMVLKSRPTCRMESTSLGKEHRETGQGSMGRRPGVFVESNPSQDKGASFVLSRASAHVAPLSPPEGGQPEAGQGHMVMG